jgi:hypothetical protein
VRATRKSTSASPACCCSLVEVCWNSGVTRRYTLTEADAEVRDSSPPGRLLCLLRVGGLLTAGLCLLQDTEMNRSKFRGTPARTPSSGRLAVSRGFWRCPSPAYWVTEFILCMILRSEIWCLFKLTPPTTNLLVYSVSN